MKKPTLRSPLVSVIVPVFNSNEYIHRFMTSLLKTKYSRFEVILVDDGSTDGTIEYLEKLSKKDERVLLIKTLKRLGLTKSRNLGIQFAHGEYIAFSETDMEFDPMWMNYEVEVLESDTTLGGVTASVHDYFSRDKLQARGIRIIPQVGWVKSLEFGLKDKKNVESEEVSMGAVGSMARISVIKKIRGFDENMDRIDDLDLGWRIWIAGYRVVTVPKAITYHVTLKSWKIRRSSVTKLQQEIALARSVQMFIKNYEFKNLVKFLPLSIVVLFLRAIINLLKGNYYSLLGLLIILWKTVFNIKSLLKERAFVQRGREFSDERLFQSIMTKSSLVDLYKQYQDLLHKKLPKLVP